MRVFLSCVSSEFKSYRLKLANHLGALKGHPFEVKVQEDFQQGGYTLLDKLADYIRECDLVIHLAGDACGARPTPEHVRAMFHKLGDTPPDPLPEWSYTQWEFHLAQRFNRKMLLYFAAADAPRDCAWPVRQTDEETRLQQSHREAIRRSGKHYAAFTSYNTFVREVFHDLGLEPELKINNLPYKSLGSLFKGREEFLCTIHQSLGRVEHLGHQRFAAITASATAATLYGLGGIGKTRAAIEYAHRYAEEYTALLFVRADSPADLQQNLAALCGPMVFDLPEKNEKEIDVQVAGVLRWLQQHAGWLLILDNVDTEDAARAVQELLGRLTPSGQVLLTSRLSGWEGAVKSLPLDVLAEVDATAFLLERTGTRRRKASGDPVQARTVAVELGKLALALEQAGAYIERYRCTFSQYLDDWNEQRDKVLSWFDERVMQYPMSVAVTWQTSFDRLSEPARWLLRILAWVAPDPIPEWLLEAGGGPFVPEKEGGTPADAREALADLEAHSLVTRADESGTFSVHRLVQDVTRRSLRGSRARLSLKEALHWVSSAFVGEPDDVRNWPVLVPLAPHAFVVACYADTEHISEPTVTLINQLGVLYLHKAQYAEAETMMRLAVEISEKSYGPHHPETATFLNNLASLLQQTNRRSEAAPLYRRALAIDESFYGPDHPKIAIELTNMAQVLINTGRVDEGEAMMRRGMEIFEKACGPNDPKVATSLNNLAQLLKATNRMTEAESLLRRALEIDEQAYGPAHPTVAGDLTSLAQLLQATNRLADADLMMRRALTIDEDAYGSNHPKIAIDLENLARLLQAMNRIAEAEPMARRALATDEHFYGPNHPKVAIDLNNLALLLKTTYRTSEAESLYRRALAIDEHSYGPEDPNVANDLNNLGVLLKTTNRPGEAESLYRRALTIDEHSYGPDHPKIAIRLNNMAQLLQATARLAEAETMMHRAVQILWKFTRDTGHDHPHLRKANDNYANLLLQMGYSKEQARAKLNEIADKYGLSLDT